MEFEDHDAIVARIFSLAAENPVAATVAGDFRTCFDSNDWTVEALDRVLTTKLEDPA